MSCGVPIPTKIRVEPRPGVPSLVGVLKREVENRDEGDPTDVKVLFERETPPTLPPWVFLYSVGLGTLNTYHIINLFCINSLPRIVP